MTRSPESPSPALRERVAAGVARGRVRVAPPHLPSPSQRFAPGPSLSRNAGEGFSLR
jgi:hypothetical protein